MRTVVVIFPHGSVVAEVADTPVQRRRGLMFRKQLAPNAAMLFVYPDDAVHSMWMRDTYIALDMIFMDASMRVVGVVEDARPLDDRHQSPGMPSRYVLEVNAGWARSHGVGPGVVGRVG